MDFYVSPVTLLFESSLVSITSLTPSQQLEIRAKINKNKSGKKSAKLKKD